MKDGLYQNDIINDPYSAAPVEIIGDASRRKIFLNGKKLDPKEGQEIYNHSPDGFSWGYLGSGCAQSALSICLELYDEGFALRHYQRFKEMFVAKLPFGEDFIVRFDPKDFLEHCLAKGN